ncbi:MAG: protein phosphatase 2C domain-containing protein [Deltaproteobacteria bacterium]|nr:protein phosphatase 2C domain-containing protein [Deltaproteobacteria bacterium]
MHGFQVAGGSVTGRAHAVLGRGNQDAFAWVDGDDALVAVVCDGCSSGRHSEVGAHLGARLVAAAVARGGGAGVDFGRHDFWAEVRGAVLGEVSRLARAMGGDLRRTVEEFFLFTIVGAALGPERAVLFSVGDGLVVVNGAATRLGPFPDNEPPYLAYGLLEEDGPRFVVQAVGPVEAVQSLLVGSDGAADLSDRQPLDDFWADDRCFANPDAVRRRLTVLARPGAGGPGLADDATLVVVRRAPMDAAAGESGEAQCASG